MQIGDRVRVRNTDREAEVVELMSSYAVRLDRVIDGYAWYNVNDVEPIGVKPDVRHWHHCAYCETIQVCSGSYGPECYYQTCADCEQTLEQSPAKLLTSAYLSEKLTEGDSWRAHSLGVLLD